MRRGTGRALWLAALALAAAACGGEAVEEAGPEAPEAAAAVELAPDFTLTDLEGEPVQGGLLFGRKLLVNRRVGCV